MELSSDFESQLRESVMDGVQEQLEDDLAEQAAEAAHDRLREVASRNDYDVENVIESLEGPDVVRDGDTITVGFRWTHEAAALFGYGTDDHWVEGNPTLAFTWEGGPGGPGQVYFSSGHEVSGIEESRFARHGVEWLGRQLEGR
ncbi:hypothetical protein [Halococcus sp. PRR34]|uniref:hypothetical protein n=1 Tax=Halococcus sp. PRR34 TaxID=3020830 RepID=UPI002361F0A5|nr:hypothetical protein [Halococcus sp. PRR34]